MNRIPSVIRPFKRSALLLLLMGLLVMPGVGVLASSQDVGPQQAVSNVVASQEYGTGLVLVTYDLEGSQAATISLEFWNGDEWVPAQAVTGVGLIEPGVGLSVTWLAREDVQRFAEDARVRVAATAGASRSAGESQPFRLDTFPPIGCGCQEPFSGAVGVSLQPRLVTLSSAQDHSGLDGFQFRLARDPDFTEGLIESDWWFADWTPPPLAGQTTYWWSVRGRDHFGNVSEWAYPFHFTTAGRARLFLPLVTRQ